MGVVKLRKAEMREAGSFPYRREERRRYDYEHEHEGSWQLPLQKRQGKAITLPLVHPIMLPAI
jgi:hypothetical protein